MTKKKEFKIKKRFFDLITENISIWLEMTEKDKEGFGDFFDWYGFWAQDDDDLLKQVHDDFGINTKLGCKCKICDIIREYKYNLLNDVHTTRKTISEKTILKTIAETIASENKDQDGMPF